jgi:small subunit ribosomal protein S4
MKKIRLVRTYGALPTLTQKVSRRDSFPGQHGEKKAKMRKRNQSKQSQYGIRLDEKQKVRHNYALSEKQFVRYVNEAKRSKQLTGHALLQLLENRLDTCVYRFGFAPTILAARQLVTHKHIQINGKTLNIPSYQCQNGDELQVTNKAGQGPVNVTCVKNKRPNIQLSLNERLVVEYYSRK